MNVLVTSAGRRGSLVKAFRKATQRRGAKTFAGDMSGLAPALYLADEGFRLPRVTDPDYVSTLLTLVREHDITLIVPTIDTELPVLAANRAAFAEAGCLALISEPRFVELCGDKVLTHDAFREVGIDVPRSWTPQQLANGRPANLPDELFVKPRDGSASQHTHRANRDDLDEVLALVPNALVQEELTGTEITIDALIDMDGQLIHYVPRVRIRTVGGESIQGVTIDDEPFRDWLRRVLAEAAALGARGPQTLQAFLTERGPVLIECNPRFGGGFPLGHEAGAKYPEWLVQMVDGIALEPRVGDYQRDVFMTRYYVEHFTSEPLW